MARLFHFSDDSGIDCFEPRPVRIVGDRPVGQEWLNGPLVWAIEENFAYLYLFPRECPRILIWPTEDTTQTDRDAWFTGSACRAVAFIERDWRKRVEQALIHRYTLPISSFEDTGEIGMWVSREAVDPISMETLSNLPGALLGQGVELRFLDELTPLKGLWSTSLHASGIRLRNAKNWGAPGWWHSSP